LPKFYTKIVSLYLLDETYVKWKKVVNLSFERQILNIVYHNESFKKISMSQKRVGLNQQPPMHQLRMRPFKPDEQKTNPLCPKLLIFLNLFSAPKFLPPSHIPPHYLPPTYLLVAFVLTPLLGLKNHWNASSSNASKCGR
jgi:hypothetical protein